MLIVVSDGIDDGTEVDDNIAMLLLQLERFNDIICPVDSAGFVVTNVDGPDFAEVMTNCDVVVDVQFRMDPLYNRKQVVSISYK